MGLFWTYRCGKDSRISEVLVGAVGIEHSGQSLSIADSAALAPPSPAKSPLNHRFLDPSWTQKSLVECRTAPKKGRRPANQSRAVEFREKLAAWQRMPEFSRPPLRAVARELGTSHQLLSHYLKTWDKWQTKEYRRRAAEIRARAWGENRGLTPWEDAQAKAYDNAAFQSMIASAMDHAMRKLLVELEAGRTLSRKQTQLVNLLVRKGFPMALKVKERCSQNSVKT